VKRQRRWRRLAKFGLWSLALLVALGLVFPTWTPRIKGEQSISLLEQIEINGTGHEVMIRGADRRNPIVIFVHGGPGCSEIPYVRKYQRELERHFTIVHYDQRGSGKSYHFFEDYADLTTDLLVDDLLALTDYVTERFGQEKALLIGHSFGTYIGMKAAAEAPHKYAAYVGIGQVSDPVQSELDSLAYTISEASKAGNVKDVERLESLRESIASGEGYTPRALVKYGGAARLIDDNMDYYSGFLLEPEYNLLDVIRYLRGIAATQERLLREETDHPITDLVRKLDIPSYFVMGQYDYMTSANAAKAYFDELDAPLKQFALFEHSAHYPQFEEQEKFAEWLQAAWREIVWYS